MKLLVGTQGSHFGKRFPPSPTGRFEVKKRVQINLFDKEANLLNTNQTQLKCIFTFSEVFFTSRNNNTTRFVV